MTYHSKEAELKELINRYKNQTYVVIKNKPFRVEGLDLNDMDEITKLEQRGHHELHYSI
jgi:hypothetical protein